MPLAIVSKPLPAPWNSANAVIAGAMIQLYFNNSQIIGLASACQKILRIVEMTYRPDKIRLEVKRFILV